MSYKDSGFHFYLKKGIKVMLRFKSFIALTAVLFIFGFAFAGMVRAQNVKKVKLPNGVEVVDISGLYDTQIENYGSWSAYGKYSTVTEIKQEGSSFVGIRLKATPYHSAGSETFRGEVDENGISKLQCITGAGLMDAVGKISDDGKTIKFDIPDSARSTMTRKE
jgi:hypothetical protein